MTESISLSFRQPEAQLGDSRRQGTRGTKMGSNITTYAKNFILCAQEITESSRGHSMINNFFFFFTFIVPISEANLILLAPVGVGGGYSRHCQGLHPWI